MPVVTVVGKDMIDSRTNVEYRSKNVLFEYPQQVVTWHKADKPGEYLS